MKHYDKDPKAGGKEISLWEHLEQSGFAERAEQKGFAFNPTHNFELLKRKRLEQYTLVKVKFTNERELNKVPTTASDLKTLYHTWLKGELSVISKWQSDTDPNGDKKEIRESFSVKLEILKYKQFVENEIGTIERKAYTQITGTEIEFYLNLTIEQKYEYAFNEHKEKFPNDTEEDFRQMEMKYQKQQIKKYENNLSPKWYETKLSIEAEKLLKYIESLSPQQNETKTDKLIAPVLGLFCSLINKIGIDRRDETESATVYCKRICIKYKLTYTDRVRQNLNVNETKKLIHGLTEKVFPLIENETKSSIQNYLDNKQPPKQKLYA